MDSHQANRIRFMQIRIVLGLRNKRGASNALSIRMKKILLAPLTIITVLLNSCGSSPDVPEEIIPVINESYVESNDSDEFVSFEQTAIPVNSAIPLATPVAGRPGFVFNPFNQNMVDVEGLRAGMKVTDPQDPDPSHIFVVP